MHPKLTGIAAGLLFHAAVFAQGPIDVTDQTIKIGGLKEEELYLGFATGDKIVFNFEEKDGKELKEVEIVEYPGNSRYSDYKSSKIENKTLTVPKTGVYVFRFKNSAVAGRICKIRIQRIPAGEDTKNFNTAVTWQTKQETTYHTYTKDVIAGYDTTYIPGTKRELVKTEQREEVILDRQERVHSGIHGNGNKTSVFFTLPPNQSSTYASSKVIAWAYWVGVGEEANQAWKQNMRAVGALVKGVAAIYTTPLGALAIGAVVDLALPKMGEDVKYSIADQANKELFMTGGNEYEVFDQGKGIAGYRKFTDPVLCQGAFYVLLSNDNWVQGIDVAVKVIAMVETKHYEDKPYTELKVSPRYEKQTFSDPVVKTVQVPVTGN